MLEKKIEQLGVYFDGMFRLDINKLGVRVIFPEGWKSSDKKTDDFIIKHYQVIDNGIKKVLFVGEGTTFDIILDFIYEVIINNLENEKKTKLFQNKVLELAELFDSNRLSKVETLVFKFEKIKKEKKSSISIEPPVIINEYDAELEEIKKLAEKEE